MRTVAPVFLGIYLLTQDLVCTIYIPCHFVVISFVLPNVWWLSWRFCVLSVTTVYCSVRSAAVACRRLELAWVYNFFVDHASLLMSKKQIKIMHNTVYIRNGLNEGEAVVIVYVLLCCIDFSSLLAATGSRDVTKPPSSAGFQFNIASPVPGGFTFGGTKVLFTYLLLTSVCRVLVLSSCSFMIIVLSCCVGLQHEGW